MTPELERLRACTDDSRRLGWTGATSRDLAAERAAADAEIARLRKEIETLTDEVAVASDKASSRMHTCPRCGFSTQPKKERSR